MKRHSVSTGAIVIRPDNRILAVQRRDTGAWVTPGGVVESGEAIPDATVREVFEETGVRIALGDLSGIYQNLSTDVVTFVFRAQPETAGRSRSADRDDAETENVRWLTLAEAEQLMRQPFIIRIRDALTQRSDPYLRMIHEPHLMAPR